MSSFNDSKADASGVAALALVRALTLYLIDAKQLLQSDIELLQSDALEALAASEGPIFEDARKLIERQFS